MKSILDLAAEYGIDLPKHRRGPEVMVKCPFHDDNKPSLSLNTEKNVFFCHGCGEKGDSATFVQKLANCDIRTALEKSGKSKFTPGNPSKIDFSRVERPHTPSIIPVPDNAPSVRDAFPLKKGSSEYIYRTEDGRVAFHVYTWRNKDGSKSVIPISYTQEGWKAQRPSPALPLYNLPEVLASDLPVMVVEGEKTAEAAKAVFEGVFVVTTWHGGVNSAKSTDFSPLYGRDVVICPDNDAPGKKVATEIAGKLSENGCQVSLFSPPADWEDGDDWADFEYPQDDALEILFNNLNDYLPSNVKGGMAPAFTPTLPVYGGIDFEPDKSMKSAAAKACLSGEHYIEYCNSIGYPLMRVKGIPMYWNGRHWSVYDDNAIEIAGKTTLIKDWETRNIVTDSTLKEFGKSVSRNLPTAPELKQRTIKINFLNGTLHINPDTGEKELKEHNIEDYLINCLPYDYDETASATAYKRALDTWIDSKEEQLRLHRVVASAFIPKDIRKMETALYLFGAGGTGKTTHLSHLARVFGKENVSHVGMRELTTQVTGVYSAVGKLVNIDDEAPATLGGNRFKALVSKSELEFRQLYKEPITTDAIPMLWMASNHRINFGDYSDAIYRRIEVFEYKNKPATVNKNLDNELETELAGTMNILIDALVGLIKNGYVIEPTEESKRQLDIQQRDTDHMVQFLEDITAVKVDTTINKEYWIQGTVLREAYATWCSKNGYKPMANQYYAQALKKHGFESIRASLPTGQATIWNLAVTNANAVISRVSPALGERVKSYIAKNIDFSLL